MKVLLLVAQIIPALVELIKALEVALPVAGMGSEKLKTVRQIIEAAYDGAAEAWPVLEKVVGSLVTLFNTAGIFKKG